MPLASGTHPISTDPRTSSPFPKSIQLIAWLLALLPALYATAMVYRYGVNIVRMDELDTVTIFAAAHDGTLTPSFLMKQANESRPAFPRLLIFALGKLTGWNTRAEMLLTQGFTLANLLLMVWIGRKVAAKANPSALTAGESAFGIVNPFVMFLMGLTLFSLWQREFLWGFQMLVHIPMTCILAAMALAHTRLHITAIVLIGAAFCFASTYSYANGLLAWPLVGAYIGYVRFADFRKSWPAMSLAPLFLAAFAATTWLYFFNYEKPRAHPKFSITHPEFFPALLAFFGAPLGAVRTDHIGQTLSATWGTFLWATLLGIALLALLRRALRDTLPLFAPSLIIAAYVGISGFITAAGRIELAGAWVVWTPTRYAGFSTYLIAAVILAVALLRHPIAKSRLHPPALWGFSYFFAAACGAFLLSTFWQDRISRDAWPEIRRTESQARAGLAIVKHATVPELNERVFPVPNALRAYLEIGRRIGLMPPGLDPADFANPASAPRAPGHIDTFSREGKFITAAGWAYLSPRRVADGIAITTTKDGTTKIAGMAFPNIPRPDVKQALNAKEILSGWQTRIEVEEGAEVHFWAIDGTNQRAYWIGKN